MITKTKPLPAGDLRYSVSISDGGLRVLIPRQLEPNDGAISFGQAAVAAALLAQGG